MSEWHNQTKDCMTFRTSVACGCTWLMVWTFHVLNLHIGEGQGSTQFISVYPIWTHKSEATLKPKENVTDGKGPCWLGVQYHRTLTSKRHRRIKDKNYLLQIDKMVEGKMKQNFSIPLNFPSGTGWTYTDMSNKNLKDYCWSQLACSDWQHSVPSVTEQFSGCK
jgi:hypothetical protein